MSYELTVIPNGATVQDTINLIVDTINREANSQTVADILRKINPNDPDFLRKLFNYVCSNVTYKLDKEGVEDITTPRRLLAEGRGDCKKFTVLFGSVLKKAGIKFYPKVISYDGKIFEHIYVIVPLNDNATAYITLDPVNYCRFNQEFRYKKAALINPNNSMQLRLLGNRPEDIFKTQYAAPMNAVAGLANTLDMAAGRNGMGANINTVMPYFVAARTGFLWLLKNNKAGMAKTFKEALAKDSKGTIKYWWEQYGGNYTKLLEAANQGSPGLTVNTSQTSPGTTQIGVTGGSGTGTGTVTLSPNDAGKWYYSGIAGTDFIDKPYPIPVKAASGNVLFDAAYVSKVNGNAPVYQLTKAPIFGDPRYPQSAIYIWRIKLPGSKLSGLGEIDTSKIQQPSQSDIQEASKAGQSETSGGDGINFQQIFNAIWLFVKEAFTLIKNIFSKDKNGSSSTTIPVTLPPGGTPKVPSDEEASAAPLIITAVLAKLLFF